MKLRLWTPPRIACFDQTRKNHNIFHKKNVNFYSLNFYSLRKNAIFWVIVLMANNFDLFLCLIFLLLLTLTVVVDQPLCFRFLESTIPLLPKFQAFSFIQWLRSPLCVGPGRKYPRPVYSQRRSKLFKVFSHVCDHVLRKPALCRCESESADQLQTTNQLTSSFLFFHFRSLLLFFIDKKPPQWLLRPVCASSEIQSFLWYYLCYMYFYKLMSR